VAKSSGQVAKERKGTEASRGAGTRRGVSEETTDGAGRIGGGGKDFKVARANVR
jgi:hypothetical protein